MTLRAFITRLLPYKIFIVNGHSMEPTIYQGSRVLVKSLFVPKKGDVVACCFSNHDVIFLKRISQITDTGYLVVGDNKEDSLDGRSLGVVPRNQIKGKVVAVL